MIRAIHVDILTFIGCIYYIVYNDMTLVVLAWGIGTGVYAAKLVSYWSNR